MEKSACRINPFSATAKALFLSALSKLTADRQDLVDTCNLLIVRLADTAKLESQLREKQNEKELLSGMIKKLIADNAATAIDQDDCNRSYNDLSERYMKATATITKLQKHRLRQLHQRDVIETFAFEIISLPDLRIEFSDRLWLNLINTATVYGDEKIVFKFKNGAEIEEEL